MILASINFTSEVTMLIWGEFSSFGIGILTSKTKLSKAGEPNSVATFRGQPHKQVSTLIITIVKIKLKLWPAAG